MQRLLKPDPGLPIHGIEILRFGSYQDLHLPSLLDLNPDFAP
jgi:hypothetical protein